VPKRINCECGYVVEGEDEDEVVAKAEAHMQEDHPEKLGNMTREEILAMAEDV
jgi:predicted small metal-binding protein